MTDKTVQEDLVSALNAMLNAVDYTTGKVKITEMLAQAVDRSLIAKARAALKRAKTT